MMRRLLLRPLLTATGLWLVAVGTFLLVGAL